MIKQVFSVYDSKAGMYSQPFMTRSKGEAVRGFSDAANDSNSSVGGHPEDFTLFQLAEFDDETGKYNNYPTPISIGVALEFIKPKSIADDLASNRLTQPLVKSGTVLKEVNK